MRAWRVIALLVLLAAAAAALWYALNGHEDQTGGGPPAQATQVAYDYEAHDVVLRQMGADGRMAFQIEAKEITQLPDSGRMTAKGVTMYHDPPGTTPGGPNRWTLTADSGELPAEGGVITLSGRVRAHGVLMGDQTITTIATDHLRYDMGTQELSTDDLVQVNWHGNDMRGRGLLANIRTAKLTLESMYGTFAP